MKIIKQAGILFALCLISQGVELLLPFPFPASVIGMMLMLILLIAKAVRPGQIKELSDFLVQNLPLLFVPATTGIINYFDLVRDHLFQLLCICVVSLFLTFAATAYAVQLTLRLMGRGEKKA